MSTIIMKKQKCISCQMKMTLAIKCKYCEDNYCVSCIQQEVHKCKKINGLIDKLACELNDKLCKERCVKRKIEKI